jgi:hypothetical protein
MVSKIGYQKRINYICTMNLIQYINSKRLDNQQITSLSELSDQEFEYYMKLKGKEQVKPKAPKAPKQKKERSDKGNKRKKYDSSLPDQYKHYLARANRKQLEFTLTVEEFIELSSGTCVYCLAPATGIDRRDSKKGYSVNNSQSCCSKCNWMKGRLREDDFIEQCQRIASVYLNR